jgi:hypothetical protein
LTVQATVDATKFQAALERFAATSKKSFAEIVMQQGRLLCEDLARITPPNNYKGGDGKLAGENAITGDLFGGRTVDVGGFRAKSLGFFIVSDGKWKKRDEIVSAFTNKNGQVYGVEQRLYRPGASVQEMRAHRDLYRSKATGRMSKAGLRTRNVGRHVFIDRMVVSQAAANRFLKQLHKRVGYMAGGWATAAQQIGRISRGFPAWIKRHGSPGEARLDQAGENISLSLTNRAVYRNTLADVTRRSRTAVAGRVYAMTAQVEKYLDGAVRRFNSP